MKSDEKILVKISVLPSSRIDKYEFLTGEKNYILMKNK